MDATLKNGKQFIITLRAWDCDSFNAGVDLDWLEHCPTCQEVLLDIQEVQE